ncbi:MAG: O-antigen ligase family protein [Alphaproteobacteria bacterium]|nr:O-antigen ligase family protein [Alphaproteobacteria bacterium]
MTRKIADAQLLSAAALVLPPLGFLAPLGIAPLLTLVALVLIALAPRARLAQVKPFRPLAILLALLSLWGALSALWSTIPAHSLFESGRLALISASGIVAAAAALSLDDAGKAKIGHAGIAGLGLGIIVALVERWGGFPLHHLISGSATDREYEFAALDRGAVALAIISWITIRHLMLQRRHIGAGLVFAAVSLTLLQLVSHSALLGFAFAAASFALGWWWPRLVAAAFAIGFAALTVAMPLIHPTRGVIIWLHDALPALRFSALHRIAIWRFASDRIAEHPFLGWGMDASRELPDGKTEVRYFLQLPLDTFDSLRGAVMPLHPHDAILQWWLELGIVGALLGLAIFAWTVWRTRRWAAAPRVVRATGLALIAAALPPLLLDFGVWQAWWQSTLWFAAAFALAVGTGAMPVARSGD